MNWQGLQRRVPLPLIGCVLGTCSYLVGVGNSSERSVANAGAAVWEERTDEATNSALQALRLDAGSPERWTDLADVMAETNRGDDARYCVEQAMARAPHLPHTAMRAAGIYYRLGDPESALRMTHRVVAETREYDPNVFQFWQRLGGTAERVFQLGIGSNTGLGRTYFQFLARAADSAAVDSAWTALRERQMAGNKETLEYAGALTAEHRYDAAAAAESGALPNGLLNSGFESNWTDQGPGGGESGWRVESISGVEVRRDETVRFAGVASLRVSFVNDNGSEFSPVSQERPLAPGTWQLRAMLRTDLKNAYVSGSAGGVDPEAMAGIGLRAVDAATGKILGSTPRLSVSRDWTPESARFTLTGSHARLVRIEVVRPAKSDLALSMSGSAWVDDVSLTPEATR